MTGSKNGRARQNEQAKTPLKTEQKEACFMEGDEERKTTQVVSLQNDRNWYL